jgi:hypothetical protein
MKGRINFIEPLPGNGRRDIHTDTQTDERYVWSTPLRFKYLMYILTDYRLILTKDRPDLSSERADPSGTALARTSSSSKFQIRSFVREGCSK